MSCSPIRTSHQTKLVTANADHLDVSWLGQTLCAEMFAELRRRGVDACGERGEYHTLVTSTPLFSRPLRWRSEGLVLRSGCWALDVVIEDP
jgi:diphthamide synthase (EF-2-diphthine--ammonia ligase)